MKKSAITLGITDNWAFAAGTVLLGLKNNPPQTPHNVIIYESDLSDKNKKLLNKIYPCQFKKFDTTQIKDDYFSRISKMAFSRYENFSLLNKYSTVVWLDSDILIKNNIDFLLQEFQSGIAMYKHEGVKLSDGMKNDIQGYNFEKEVFASGSLIISDTIPEPKKLQKWCFEKTNEWGDRISGDMQILNLMLQEFNLKPYELPETYCCHPKNEKLDTIIVHPWWKKKFWNETIHPLWNKYYSEWKELGGDGPKLPHSFKRYIKNIIWKLKLIYH